VWKNEISGFYGGTYVPPHSADIAEQTVTSLKDKQFAETFQAFVPAAVYSKKLYQELFFGILISYGRLYRLRQIWRNRFGQMYLTL